MTVSNEHIDILKTGKWFQNLLPHMQQALLDLGVFKRFQNSQVLFSRGDEADGLYAVLCGNIRITGLNSEGKEAILTFVESPNWIGEVALFDRGDRTHDAFAVGDCEVLHIPQLALDRLLETHPEYWREFGLLVAHKLRLAFRAIEDLALLPAPLRLARRLILMAEGYGELDGEARNKLFVPQDQLGSMLSISRQTTNHILKDLAEKGFIKVAYGEIEIINLADLKRFSIGEI